MNNESIEARGILKDSEIVFIYAGAGMSADLGIQTYWSGETALYGSDKSKFGFTTLEHANASMWNENYEDQKAYSIDRFNSTQSKLELSEENVYTKLLEYLESNSKKYVVATSNVDGAFEYYGYNPESIYEAHGNHNFLQCNKFRHGIFLVNPEFNCPTCGSQARSNIFMFDDYNFHPEREEDQSYKYLDKLYELSDKVDAGSTGVILEMGVGRTVSKIRGMARKQHWSVDTPYIHVNTLDPSEADLEWSSDSKELWVKSTANDFVSFL